MSCRLKLRAQHTAVPPRQVDLSTQTPVVGTHRSFLTAPASNSPSCHWGAHRARPSQHRWVAQMCLIR
jgi:hypothetical protein